MRSDPALRRSSLRPIVPFAAAVALALLATPIMQGQSAVFLDYRVGYLLYQGFINLMYLVGGASVVAGVLLSRRRPVLATLLCLAPFVLAPLLGTFAWAWLLGLFVVAVIAAFDGVFRAAVPLAASMAVLFAYWALGAEAVVPFTGLVDLGGESSTVTVIIYVFVVSVFVAGSGALGVAARAQGTASRRTAAAAKTEREALEVSSVANERARLARDLHDVVAHHVSLVAVRAESAPYVHPDLSDDARAVLADIAGDARAALGELRQVLTVLRRSDDAERAPQPGADDVAGLVAQACAAGQRVTYQGVDETLPAAEGYVLFRAVQEALTNARRHAPQAPVEVAVTIEESPDGAAEDALRLYCTNSLDDEHQADEHRADEHPARAPRVEPGDVVPGRGLLGMRERVEALGGTVVARVDRPGSDGGAGFVLDVTIPLVRRRFTRPDALLAPAVATTYAAATLAVQVVPQPAHDDAPGWNAPGGSAPDGTGLGS